MARGGKREGAGRKKGAEAIDKAIAREIVRQQVYAELAPLLHAQIANAKGIHYLVVREKTTGKFLRVSAGAAEKLNPEEEIIEIWEKDPSVQAFTDLMNRALDKPKEQEQEVQHTGGMTITWKVSA